MQTFTKRYIANNLEVRRAFRTIPRITGTVNSRKIGKHRRGTLMITGCSGRARDDGLWEVNITFLRGAPNFWKAVSRRTIRSFSDYRKVLRFLHKRTSWDSQFS